MNTQRHYDLVVIGSGAAGHHGAIQGAKLGKTVAVIERATLAWRRYHQHRHDPQQDSARSGDTRD